MNQKTNAKPGRKAAIKGTHQGPEAVEQEAPLGLRHGNEPEAQASTVHPAVLEAMNLTYDGRFPRGDMRGIFGQGACRKYPTWDSVAESWGPSIKGSDAEIGALKHLFANFGIHKAAASPLCPIEGHPHFGANGKGKVPLEHIQRDDLGRHFYVNTEGDKYARYTRYILPDVVEKVTGEKGAGGIPVVGFDDILFACNSAAMDWLHSEIHASHRTIHERGRAFEISSCTLDGRDYLLGIELLERFHLDRSGVTDGMAKRILSGLKETGAEGLGLLFDDGPSVIRVGCLMELGEAKELGFEGARRRFERVMAKAEPPEQRQFRCLEAQGLVRITVEREDTYDLDELKGDAYKPEVADHISPEELRAQEKEFEAQVADEGVWHVGSKAWDPRPGQGFVDSGESIGGFVGGQFWGSGYEAQVMQAAIDKARELNPGEVERLLGPVDTSITAPEGKIKLVRDLTASVLKTVEGHIRSGRIPETWDGHELRAYLAEKFEESKASMDGRRLKDYKNDVIVNNL